jgi:hypothetical protein
MAAAVPDLVLADLLARAEADVDTLGLIVGGSRGAGCADAESDYDLDWVLTDAAYDKRQVRGEPMEHGGKPLLDIGYTCPRELRRVADEPPGWWTPGYATARVLLDKTGVVTRALRAITLMPEDKAAADVPASFDAYLNAFYRSLKAWRRGNELGGRLQAAESVMHLARLLFALERRWTPYHDRLDAQLDTLSEAQNWPPGYLRETLLAVVRTGSPALQQELEGRVEALLRARGHGGVVDAWNGEIERVAAFRFDGK